MPCLPLPAPAADILNDDYAEAEDETETEAGAEVTGRWSQVEQQTVKGGVDWGEAAEAKSKEQRRSVAYTVACSSSSSSKPDTLAAPACMYTSLPRAQDREKLLRLARLCRHKAEQWGNYQRLFSASPLFRFRPTRLRGKT
jgi:hypothetical protein